MPGTTVLRWANPGQIQCHSLKGDFCPCVTPHPPNPASPRELLQGFMSEVSMQTCTLESSSGRINPEEPCWLSRRTEQAVSEYPSLPWLLPYPKGDTKDLFIASYCFPWRTCDRGIKVFTDGGEAAERGGHRPRDHVGSQVKWELGRELFCESSQSFDGNRGNTCLHLCTFLHHLFVCNGPV